jgi:thiaminase
MKTMRAKDLIQMIRSKLQNVNEMILNHQFIIEAEEGKLPIEAFKTFAGQQYYIVSHDARNLALMASRATNTKEFEFFLELSKGDIEALKLLEKMGRALNLTKLDNIEPIPEAVAYTHYLAWLALYGNPGYQAVALIINLPVWGSNCRKLSNALKNRYNIHETGFLDLFSQPYEQIENRGLEIIENYLNYSEGMIRVSRLIQKYELMFWDAIYREVKKI